MIQGRSGIPSGLLAGLAAGLAASLSAGLMAGVLLVVAGTALADAAAPVGRPPVVTTTPSADDADGSDVDAPFLAATSGADHRWFVGRRDRGIGGYGVGHQGPEMESGAFRIVSILAAPPRAFVAFGPRAWVIAEPPAAGAESPVFAIRLARNPVHDVWYPRGARPLTPVARFPAGREPLVAAATPTGPMVIARAIPRPDARDEPTDLRLIRLGLDGWTERPLRAPPGVSDATAAGERPLSAVVVRVDAAESPADDADAPDGPAGPDGSDDSGDADETDSPEAGDVFTLTLMLVAGPDALAIDFIASTGERWRAWTGRPDLAARLAGGSADRPIVELVAADRRVWLAIRDGGRLAFEPFAPIERADEAVPSLARLMPAAGDAGSIERAPGDAAADAGVRRVVVGGRGPMEIVGDGLEDEASPPTFRAWTAAGVLESEGPLVGKDVDPSVVLRGPIIIGTGVFFAVIAGVLTSRPGPRPPAIEGREAPVRRRVAAALVDALAPLVASSLVFAWTPETLLASLLLLHPAGYGPWAGFTLLWAFAIVVGDLGGGRTPGRIVFRLRLVDIEGRRPGRGRLVIRFGLRVASVAFPPLILFWLAHARGRGVHDLAAGTWVVAADTPTE